MNMDFSLGCKKTQPGITAGLTHDAEDEPIVPDRQGQTTGPNRVLRAEARFKLCCFEYQRLDGNELAKLSTIHELHVAIALCEQGIVLAAPNVQARLNARAALADDDGASGHKLTTESFHSKPLCIRVAAVTGTA
jgi:hypothetical protein